MILSFLGCLPFATKTLPTRKKYFRIIFRLPFHDFAFFELILKNYPIPIAFVRVVWHCPVGTPVLVELFFITVTRFEIFRINWVMFSWQMVMVWPSQLECQGLLDAPCLDAVGRFKKACEGLLDAYVSLVEGLGGIVSFDLVAIRRWIRLSRDANGPRNVKLTNPAKQKPISSPHFSLLVVRNRSWKCLHEGNFTPPFVWQRNAAIRVPKEHKGDGRYRGETFEVLAKRNGETCH